VYPITPKSTFRTLLELAKADVLLLGHSHIPVEVVLGSKLVVNPGSVGQPRDGDSRASYAILEVHDGRLSHTIRRVRYDVDSAARKILESHLPGILADRLHFGF
jgi:predicted phosphodiesterase